MVMRRRGKVLPRVVLVLAIVFIGLQVIRPEKTNPPVESDLIAVLAPPPEVAQALKRSCYDCHSHETRWPWYSAIMPASFFVVEHVEHAREELNLSKWAAYTGPAALHKLKEAVEEVEEGEMPLPSYLFLHRSARWSAEEKAAFEGWVEALEAKEKPIMWRPDSETR